jgi:methyl-accepting chemotaxis protein
MKERVKPGWSINFRFTLLILLTTVLFFITIYFITFTIMRSYSLQNSEEIALTILDSTDSRLRNLFENFESLAIGLASTNAVRNTDIPIMRDLFVSSVLAWKRYIRAIYLGTAQGKMYEWGFGAEFVNFSPTFPLGYDPRTRPWYKLGESKAGFSVSPPYLYASVNALGITCVVPVRNTEGVLLGVLGLDILLKNLRNILTDLNVPKRGEAFIFSTDGQIIAGDKKEEIGNHLPVEQLRLPNLSLMLQQNEGMFKTMYKGEETRFYYRRTYPANWFLIVGIPTESIMDSVNKLLSYISIIELMIMALQLLALNIISNRLISSPLRKMISVINRIEGGERALRIQIHSTDEFGLLGGELNKLFDAAEEYSASLESKVRERTEALRKLQRENTRLRVAEERKRIYRDMHDSIGAKLTNIFFSNNVARSAKEREPEKLSELFDSIENNCLEAVRDLKTIVGGLKAEEGPNRSFIGSLKEEARLRLRQGRIKLVFKSGGSDAAERLGASLKRELRKVFDELITNALKYSDATMVRIVFSTVEGTLVVTFKDNGKGFDLETANSMGQGLRNIRYRVENSGGEVLLESKPGKGTRYTFRIPLSGSIIKT